MELVRRFDELVAVDGVSFDVKKGEVFGFLGPNGAGKTTTMNMLSTIIAPTSGTALVNGYDIVAQKNEVRESIGMVFQDPSLDDTLTARENLEFHCVVYHIPRSDRDSRMREVLEMVSLTDRADDRVQTYSGGMKRRLEIARGLLHYPKVLFLDEPTIGLDPQTRNYIWEYIEGLKRREGITIFLTTHYMEEAEHCDRIAIIDLGDIIALDTPDALKTQVGGDIIKITTDDDDAALTELHKRYPDIEMLKDPDCKLCFERERGEEFVPELIREFGVRIVSINVHRPTLDDVFLKMTGKEIRDESGDRKEAMMKLVGKMGGPPRR
ncbi:MAG: ATP-binding cassette domain-containing protein [Actinobacteria bacterium]|nr:ATP-binding cassette domain-containing protein [Actinomycetota bacterium]MBU2686365.1 ATP-binding cassette domain-containing protein [Actinomycetota bacterium]